MSESTKFSRRDILTFKPLVNALSEPGEVSKETKEATGEGLSNAAVFASLIGLAWMGSRDKLVHYKADSERRLDALDGFEAKMKETLRMKEMVSGLSVQLSELYTKWRAEYRKSRLVSKYNSETKKIETETEYYWKEPEEYTSIGIDNAYIEKIRDYFKDLDGKLGRLQADADNYFDLTSGDRGVFYDEKVLDKDKQFRSSGLLYGGVAVMFMLYEEALDERSKIMPERSFGIVDSKRYVGRRAFMKTAAAFLGYGVLRKVQKKFALNNVSLLNDIRQNTAKVTAQMDVGEQTNFSRFFGVSVDHIGDTLHHAKDLFTEGDATTVEGDEPDEGVRSEMSAVLSSVEHSIQQYATLFGPEKKPPAELTEITKYAWASRKIIEYTNDRTAKLKTRHWLNALALGLGFAGVAALSEAVLFPASDKIVESKERTYHR